jgi:hypothetical protein
VEVADLGAVHAGREQPCEEEFREPVKLKSSSNNLKPFLKVALPVAAVVVVALGLWFNVPSVKALTVGQIYSAIDKVKNIYITSFVPDKQEPVQEQWFLRSNELYVAKVKNEFVLWNIPNKIKKTKHLDTGTIEQSSLVGDSLAGIKTWIYSPLIIMPFRTPSDIPKEAKWSEITDVDLHKKAGNVEIYELSWTEKTQGGLIVQRNWLVFADISTKLPNKVQWFSKSVSDAQPVLELTMVIEYPDDQQVQTILDEMAF